MASSMFQTMSAFPVTSSFKTQIGFQVDNVSEHDDEEDDVFPCQVPEPVASGVGWNGLLEISRGSGMSGVVGATVESVTTEPDSKIEICCTAHTSPEARNLVRAVINGLKAMQAPEKTESGMGGTYFFLDEDAHHVGIFKPCDEEPLAPNNPKGYVGRSLGDPGWKPTVRVGEAAMREVAAYLLDHKGFARVPVSVLVRARHEMFCYNSKMKSVRLSYMDLSGPMREENRSGPLPMKLGSLQEYVRHECDTSEMGPSRFRVSDVHRIGILDIRLCNTDRHAGNMLVVPCSQFAPGQRQYSLIPIDHGFCLPEGLDSPYFEWLYWPQALMPFSPEELQYIAELDVESDKALLRREVSNLRPGCLRVLEVCTVLLQRCAAAGLTLNEIGNVMTRPCEGGEDGLSELDKLCQAAQQVAELPIDDLSEDDEDEDSYRLSEEDDEEGEGRLSVNVDDEGEEDVTGRLSSGLLTMQVTDHSSKDAVAASMFDLELSGSASSCATISDTFNRTISAPSPKFSIPAATTAAPIPTPSAPIPMSMHISSPFLNAGPPPAAGAAYSLHASNFTRNFAQRSRSKGPSASLKSKGSPKARRRQLYPHPVPGAAPNSMDSSLGGLTEDQWVVFMEELVAGMDLAIESGQWKAAAVDRVAMTCPRF